jgi:hypothetical protein
VRGGLRTCRDTYPTFHLLYSITGPPDMQAVAKYEIEMIVAGTPLYPNQGGGRDRDRNNAAADPYAGMYGGGAWGQQAAYGMGAAGGYYGAANPYGAAQGAYGMPAAQSAYGYYGAGAAGGAAATAYGAYGAAAAAPGTSSLHVLWIFVSFAQTLLVSQYSTRCCRRSRGGAQRPDRLLQRLLGVQHLLRRSRSATVLRRLVPARGHTAPTRRGGGQSGGGCGSTCSGRSDRSRRRGRRFDLGCCSAERTG